MNVRNAFMKMAVRVVVRNVLRKSIILGVILKERKTMIE